MKLTLILGTWFFCLPFRPKEKIGLFVKIRPGEFFFRPPGGENYQLSIYPNSLERSPTSYNELFLTPKFVLCNQALHHS